MSTFTSLLTKKLSIPTEYLFWRSQSRFIFENVAAAVIAVDMSGCITIFNNEAANVFSRKQENVLGKPFRSVFPGFAEHEYYLLQTLKTGREIKDIEHAYCPYTDQGGCFAHSIALVKGISGEVLGAIWMRKDITHERRFHEEVSNAQIQAIVSQIAAATAHEIRNPLTTTKGYVQLAAMQSEPDSLVRNYLAIAIEEIDEINRKITDFLTLIYPGIDGLQFVCFNTLVEELVQLVKNVGIMVDIHIEAILDKQIPLCLLDAKMVKQALLNVIRNSIQAMPQGGHISIQTSYLKNTDEISITVSDTGCGISEEDIGLIFAPFFSTNKGSGLGLTLTNRIVVHHDGRVNVSSVVGEGTTITLVLPVSKT